MRCDGVRRDGDATLADSGWLWLTLADSGWLWQFKFRRCMQQDCTWPDLSIVARGKPLARTSS